jgi:uncharacterized protein YdeI (YjbR/CyaY-like superfamily)
VDADRGALRYTPRRRGSVWASSNKRRVQRLIDEGRMTDAGLRAIEDAKRDGTWQLLDAVEALEVPADLADALAADPAAAANFERFTPSAKRQFLWHVVSAKRPDTRARRIAETIELAAQGLRLDQRNERR